MNHISEVFYVGAEEADFIEIIYDRIDRHGSTMYHVRCIGNPLPLATVGQVSTREWYGTTVNHHTTRVTRSEVVDTLLHRLYM